MAQVITGETEDEIYRQLLHNIYFYGETVAPRGKLTKALRNVTILHENAEDCLLIGVRPGMSGKLAAMEALQLVGGFSDPELTVKVVPHYANFMDDGEFYGAYGLRTRDAVDHVIRKLASDQSTRQAQMSFWDNSKDLAVEGKHDYPCTISAHFEVYALPGEPERLHGTTVMRSNDAWLGYPYDVVQHTSLLRSIANALCLGVGTYTHIVHNMHLYATDFEKVGQTLDKLALPKIAVAPRLLQGGIGIEGGELWTMVQDRARQIFYEPQTVEPASIEEAWMVEQMKKVYEA